MVLVALLIIIRTLHSSVLLLYNYTTTPKLLKGFVLFFRGAFFLRGVFSLCGCAHFHLADYSTRPAGGWAPTYLALLHCIVILLLYSNRFNIYKNLLTNFFSIFFVKDKNLLYNNNIK